MGASCADLFWLLLRKTDNPITRAAAMIAHAKTLLLGYSPAMSEALRFANFVTEADHMLLDQQRRKSKLDSQEAARTKTVELLKAQMSQAQTKREQNSVWTAFGEHQERELNELIAEELESLKTILLSGLS